MRLRDLLDIPALWHLFRWLLDLGFGAYRKRNEVMRSWGIRGGTGSVLDVGCGIGQFSDLSSGPYLGVDLHPGYIERARKLHPRANVTFRCIDVAELAPADGRFDTVLLIGILHHLSDRACGTLLDTLRGLTEKQLVVMEVIQEQTNPLGRWIKNNDRGEYVRHRDRLLELVGSAGFELRDERILYLGPTRTIATLWSPRP